MKTDFDRIKEYALKNNIPITITKLCIKFFYRNVNCGIDEMRIFNDMSIRRNGIEFAKSRTYVQARRLLNNAVNVNCKS